MAIARPFAAMSQSFGKQANVYWYGVLRLCATGAPSTSTPRMRRATLAPAALLAHEICRLDAARTDGTIRGIGPDRTSQVSVVFTISGGARGGTK